MENHRAFFLDNCAGLFTFTIRFFFFLMKIGTSNFSRYYLPCLVVTLRKNDDFDISLYFCHHFTTKVYVK